jgi:hypothetical protein
MLLLLTLSCYYSPWVDVVYCRSPYVVVVLLFVQALTSPSLVLLLFASTLRCCCSPCVTTICWGVVFLPSCHAQVGAWNTWSPSLRSPSLGKEKGYNLFFKFIQ